MIVLIGIIATSILFLILGIITMILLKILMVIEEIRLDNNKQTVLQSQYGERTKRD